MVKLTLDNGVTLEGDIDAIFKLVKPSAVVRQDRQQTKKHERTCKFCGKELTGYQQIKCSSPACKKSAQTEYETRYRTKKDRKHASKRMKVCTICGTVLPKGKKKLCGDTRCMKAAQRIANSRWFNRNRIINISKKLPVSNSEESVKIPINHE